MSAPVQVTRRIAAPAATIFALLADPRRHLDLDGSDMLRGAVTTVPVTAVGDVFVMRMFYVGHGEYEMDNHVVEFEPDRRIGWEPAAGRGHPDHGTDASSWGQRWSYLLEPDGVDATIVTESYDCSEVPADERVGMDDGRMWLTAMADTLARLDALATGTPHATGTPDATGSTG